MRIHYTFTSIFIYRGKVGSGGSWPPESPREESKREESTREKFTRAALG